MKIEVKVFPGSNRECISEKDGKIKVYVNPSADKGKANARLIEIVAEKYKVKKRDVRILRGASSRDKLLEVDLARQTKKGKDRDNRG